MRRQKWVLAAAGVAAAAVLLGGGAVMAQQTGNGGTPTFLDRVAQKLGIDTPKLQEAVKGARTDQIDEAVTNGDLTQAQADKLKSRLDQMPDGGFGPKFGPGRGGGFGPGPMPFGMGKELGAAQDKLAEYLGISTDQLKQELQADGATLATVAGNHGKSRDDLKGFITDGAKQKLDEAVKNGDMTQKQEDAILSTLSSHLDDLIDHNMHGFGGMMPGFGRGHHGKDGGSTPPAEGGEVPEGIGQF